jgi:hypothetical protein
MTFLVVAAVVLGIALVTFAATRLARLIAFLRRPRRR